MKDKDTIGSGLNRAGKNSPFSVPGDYFDSFPGKLRQRLQTENIPRITLTVRIWQVLRPQLALAAAIAGFAIISYLSFRTFIQTEQEWPSNDDIAKYINYYQYEFSEYYLLSLLEENGLYQDESLIFDDDIYFYDDQEAYLDFLYKENIDLDILLREL